MLHRYHLLPHLAAAIIFAVTACCQQANARDDPAVGHRIRLAQAGSTGGSVGKRDKSISGEENRSPEAGRGRSTHESREEGFPKTIQLNERWHGLNYTITLNNVGGGNYQGTWSHGYVTKFTVTAFTGNSMKMRRTDNPAFGAVNGSYTGTRTGNRAAGEAAISNGATSQWDASW